MGVRLGVGAVWAPRALTRTKWISSRLFVVPALSSCLLDRHSAFLTFFARALSRFLHFPLPFRLPPFSAYLFPPVFPPASVFSAPSPLPPRRCFGTKCAGCAQGISPSDLVRRARSKVFHLNCFTCMMCNKQLSTGEELYIIDENKFVCKEDYLSNSSVAKENSLHSGEAPHLPAPQGRAGPGRGRWAKAAAHTCPFLLSSHHGQ